MPSWTHHNARADPWLEEAQGRRSAVPCAGLSGRHGQAPSTDQLVLLPAPSCLSLRIHSVALSTFSPAVDLPVIHLLNYLPNSPITKRIYQDTLFLPPTHLLISAVSTEALLRSLLLERKTSSKPKHKELQQTHLCYNTTMVWPKCSDENFLMQNISTAS